MRVPAGLDAGEIADVENDSAGHRIRRDQLWRPGVVADPVDDHQLCARNGSRVGGRRLVVVGVGGGADGAKTPKGAETRIAWVKERGSRRGDARRAVVELLGRQQCCLTAQEIFDQLRSEGRRVGIASVYRTLEQLSRDGYVQR